MPLDTAVSKHDSDDTVMPFILLTLINFNTTTM